MRASHVIASGLAVFVTGAMLAGCGSGETPASSGDLANRNPAAGATDGRVIDNACDLVTRDEVAATAGNPVDNGTLVGIVCVWKPEDPGNSANVQVSVRFVPTLGGDPKELCEATRSGTTASMPFDGIGHAAFWEYQPGSHRNGGSLHVCAYTAIVDTAAIGARPEAELQRIATSLASTALGRITGNRLAARHGISAQNRRITRWTRPGHSPSIAATSPTRRWFPRHSRSRTRARPCSESIEWASPPTTSRTRCWGTGFVTGSSSRRLLAD